MGPRVQPTVGCFPELCFFRFSVAQVLVTQLINNFVFPTWACAAGFENNNNNNFAADRTIYFVSLTNIAEIITVSIV